MAKGKSSHPLFDDLMKMLKSDDATKVATATDTFVRIGTPSAETLFADAENRRLSVKNRLRMLAVVRKIGLPLSPNNLVRLQVFMEDKSPEIANAAGEILADASPAGAAAIPMIACLTGIPFGLASRKRRKRTKAARSFGKAW